MARLVASLLWVLLARGAGAQRHLVGARIVADAGVFARQRVEQLARHGVAVDGGGHRHRLLQVVQRGVGARSSGSAPAARGAHGFRPAPSARRSGCRRRRDRAPAPARRRPSPALPAAGSGATARAPGRAARRSGNRPGRAPRRAPRAARSCPARRRSRRRRAPGRPGIRARWRRRASRPAAPGSPALRAAAPARPSRWPSWRSVSAVCIRPRPTLIGQPVGRARSRPRCIHSSAAWCALRLVKPLPILVARLIARRTWPVAIAASKLPHQQADGAAEIAGLEGVVPA